MLVTLTPRFRVHRDEVLQIEQHNGRIKIVFCGLRTRSFTIDDLTPEARAWLLPSEADREIHNGCECEEVVVDEAEESAADHVVGRDTVDG